MLFDDILTKFGLMIDGTVKVIVPQKSQEFSYFMLQHSFKLFSHVHSVEHKSWRKSPRNVDYMSCFQFCFFMLLFLSGAG